MLNMLEYLKTSKISRRNIYKNRADRQNGENRKGSFTILLTNFYKYLADSVEKLKRNT